MNFDRLAQMVLRRFIRQAVQRGVNAGLRRVSKEKPDPDAKQVSSGDASQKTRSLGNMLRRF